ncbi:MAG: hypothetical protein WCQ67_01215 [Treponema sp.]
MSFPPEYVTEKFLRTFTELFTVRDMEKYLSQSGLHASASEVENFLLSHPLVFPLEKNLYITKAGAFTNKYFSIKPTSSELAQNMFVVGDRCIPFADSESFSFNFNFYINGKKLPQKVGQFDSDAAIDMFVLYGEEYAPQYIASDPANKDLNLIDSEFTLPNKVNLTGIDISYLKEKYGFSKNDRLLCNIVDWNKNNINIQIIHDQLIDDPFNNGMIGEKRLQWYGDFENLLLDSFNTIGPCSSIEEQLADVFFENRKTLCVPYCGSVEEYLNKNAKKVGIEYFGVETRLWNKGEQVPAVGKWNELQMEFVGKAAAKMNVQKSSFYMIPDFVFDQYILDMFYSKSEDKNSLVKKIYPQEINFSQEELKSINLHLEERNAILRRDYNWFADQTLGNVRQQALDLYTKVSFLVYEIDTSNVDLKNYPQQELVILSQLYSHLTRILESVASDNSVEEESEAILLSLDGMRMNFEDIADELRYAVSEQKRNQFKIVKKQ